MTQDDLYHKINIKTVLRSTKLNWSLGPSHHAGIELGETDLAGKAGRRMSTGTRPQEWKLVLDEQKWTTAKGQKRIKESYSSCNQTGRESSSRWMLTKHFLEVDQDFPLLRIFTSKLGLDLPNNPDFQHGHNAGTKMLEMDILGSPVLSLLAAKEMEAGATNENAPPDQQQNVRKE